MIKVSIFTRELYEKFENELSEDIKIHYKSKNNILMVMTDKDRLICVGVVSIHSNYAVLEQIYNFDGDFQIDYAMGKSLLNFLDLNNIFDVFCVYEKLFELAKRLHFKEVLGKTIPSFKGYDTLYYLNLINYFTKKC